MNRPTEAELELQARVRELMLEQADELTAAIVETIRATALEAFAVGYQKGRSE